MQSTWEALKRKNMRREGRVSLPGRGVPRQRTSPGARAVSGAASVLTLSLFKRFLLWSSSAVMHTTFPASRVALPVAQRPL